MMKKLLETERLIIRNFVKSDIDELFHLYNTLETMLYIDGSIRTYQQTKDYLSKYLEEYETYGFGLYAIILKENRKMIGRGGLIPSDDGHQVEGELAYLFSKEYWGYGFATEFASFIVQYGLSELQLNRIFAIVEQENKASINVLNKVKLNYLKLISKTKIEYEIERATRL